MSNYISQRSHKCSAVAALDEIIAFGVVLILFSATLVLSSGFYDTYSRNNENDRLYQKALEISKIIRNHERIIYNGQAGIIELNKLMELEDHDLAAMVTISKQYGAELNFVDISAENNRFEKTFRIGSKNKDDFGNREQAVSESPLNLYLNELEVHAAILTVILRG
jgi:hypothetical protein